MFLTLDLKVIDFIDVSHATEEKFNEHVDDGTLSIRLQCVAMGDFCFMWPKHWKTDTHPCHNGH